MTTTGAPSTWQLKSGSGAGDLLMNTALDLARKWREEALVLEERYLDSRAAELFRLHARELEEAVQDAEEEVLTIAEAAATSGYSVDHIRHQVAAGKITNMGVKGAPRVRRGDLPLKPGPRERATARDAAATARSILQSVGSETL